MAWMCIQSFVGNGLRSVPLTHVKHMLHHVQELPEGASFKDWRHSVCLQWEQGHFYVVAANYKKRVYPFPFFREPELKCGLVPFLSLRDLRLTP